MGATRATAYDVIESSRGLCCACWPDIGRAVVVCARVCAFASLPPASEQSIAAPHLRTRLRVTTFTLTRTQRPHARCCHSSGQQPSLTPASPAGRVHPGWDPTTGSSTRRLGADKGAAINVSGVPHDSPPLGAAATVPRLKQCVAKEQGCNAGTHTTHSRTPTHIPENPARGDAAARRLATPTECHTRAAYGRLSASQRTLRR